jgi:hypothetical protein
MKSVTGSRFGINLELSRFDQSQATQARGQFRHQLGMGMREELVRGVFARSSTVNTIANDLANPLFSLKRSVGGDWIGV